MLCLTSRNLIVMMRDGRSRGEAIELVYNLSMSSCFDQTLSRDGTLCRDQTHIESLSQPE